MWAVGSVSRRGRPGPQIAEVTPRMKSARPSVAIERTVGSRSISRAETSLP